MFLGLKPSGGNYSTVKRLVADLGLDTSHWTGQAWNKGKKLGSKQPLENYLVVGSTISSYKLKLKLLSEGFKEAKCECCGIEEWNGQKAPLEIDHINGVNNDNSLDNLRILCPNCHAQTETYRGKNVRKVKQIGDCSNLEN